MAKASTHSELVELPATLIPLRVLCWSPSLVGRRWDALFPSQLQINVRCHLRPGCLMEPNAGNSQSPSHWSQVRPLTKKPEGEAELPQSRLKGSFSIC